MKYVCIIVLTGNILAFIGETTLTWTAPILSRLFSNDSSINPLGQPITISERSWIESLQYIGAIVGAIPFGILPDMIGRKPTLLLLAIPHIVAFFCFAFAKTIGWFYLGRFLGGMSLSAVYLVLPMYVAEISEDSYRGISIVSYGIFASFGDLFPCTFGPYVSIMWYNLILAIFPITFLVLFLLLAPESPYFYTETAEVEKSLKKLRERNVDYIINEELNKIKNERQNNKKGEVWSTLKKKHVIKAFIVSLGVCSFQQLSGLGAMYAYISTFFETAGINISKNYYLVLTGIVLFLASFLAPLGVDRQGRKFLLICSTGGCIISQAILGLYFYIEDNTNYSLTYFNWLPIFCLMVYITTFNIGLGPLPYCITSEIFPSNVKFPLAIINAFISWLLLFIVTKLFDYFKDTLGRAGIFWLFSGFCILALLFIILVVPETKGKSFQEIQNILDR